MVFSDNGTVKVVCNLEYFSEQPRQSGAGSLGGGKRKQSFSISVRDSGCHAKLYLDEIHKEEESKARVNFVFMEVTVKKSFQIHIKCDNTGQILFPHTIGINKS